MCMHGSIQKCTYLFLCNLPVIVSTMPAPVFPYTNMAKPISLLFHHTNQHIHMDMEPKGIGYANHHHHQGDNKEQQQKHAGEEEEEEEVLKTRISAHPLYGRLVENHLNCLKIGGIVGDGGRKSSKMINNQRKAADYSNPCSSMLNQSELDLFMEAYCSALSKLKEAMEEPQQETIAFIKGMHSQLRELARTNPQTPDVFLATEITQNGVGSNRKESQMM